VHVVILWTALVRSQARVTKPTVKGGLTPADAVEVKGRVQAPGAAREASGLAG